MRFLHAIDTANDLGMITAGLTGADGGKMKGHCDHLIRVPSENVARIQEAHIMIGHIICEIIESNLFAS